MRTAAALLVFTFVLGGCGTTSNPASVSPALDTTAGVCLSDSQLATLPTVAIAGDMAAIKALTIHYSVCIDDRPEAIGWMRVGSNFGDIESRESLIDELQRRKNPQELGEAKKLAEQWGMERLLD